MSAGPDVLKILQRALESSQKVPWSLLSEQVRFVANYARECQYRQDEYAKAESLLIKCRQILQDHGDPEKRHGHQAAVSYYLGATCRQHGSPDAEGHFRDSLELLRCKALVAADDVELRATRRRAGVVLGLGLGFWTRNQGRLRRSLTLFSTAELLLGDPGDIRAEDVEKIHPIHRAYLNVLRASVLRAQPRDPATPLNPDDPQGPKALLGKALDTFLSDDFYHQRYAARAAQQFALYEMDARNFKEAERHIKRLEREAGNNARLRSSVHVLRSRLARHQGKEGALEEAETAVSIMEHSNDVEGLFEVLVAQGQAQLESKDHDAALRSFRTARSSAGELNKNPKVAAVLALNIAWAELLRGRIPEAKAEFEKWTEIKHMVEHDYVGKTANDVEALLIKKTGIGFSVPVSEHNLDAEEHIRELRKWLVAQAKLRFPNNLEKQQEALGGVSRATIYNWEKGKTPQAPSASSRKARN